MASIDLSIAIPIGAALVTTIGVLWRELGRVKADGDARRDECEERLRKEMRYGVRLAMMPRSQTEPPPEELPQPDWEENTNVRNMRALVQREELDGVLRHYIESTPPRPRGRMPSRPR